ncbi:hypothetical protein Tco_0737113 [Tanacetum coccineum]
MSNSRTGTYGSGSSSVLLGSGPVLGSGSGSWFFCSSLEPSGSGTFPKGTDSFEKVATSSLDITSIGAHIDYGIFFPIFTWPISTMFGSPRVTMELIPEIIR